MKYTVAIGHTLWHSKQDKYYGEGETIDLSHLPPSDVALLIEINVVNVVQTFEKPIKKEVENGKT